MDWVLLETARAMALRGTCSRARVGCVIAVDSRVCSTGFNGAPHGLPHCEHGDELSATSDATDAGCQTAVHAEANAIVFAARHGTSIAGGTLYTTLTPCVTCAMLILNAGITRVVCAVQYRDQTGTQLLSAAGVTVMILESDRRRLIVHGPG